MTIQAPTGLLPRSACRPGAGAVADRMFTLAEARAMLPDVRERAARLITVRADLVIATANHNAGIPTSVADIKAFEANMGEVIDGFRAWGLRVVGYAPLLLDFRARIADREAWLCWLENEPDIQWWHGDDVGFMGRRRLDDAGLTTDAAG